MGVFQGGLNNECQNRPPYIGPDDAILSREGVLDDSIAVKGVFSP